MNEKSHQMNTIISAISAVKDLPSSRELSVVVTKLQEAQLWLQEYESTLIPLQESYKTQAE